MRKPSEPKTTRGWQRRIDRVTEAVLLEIEVRISLYAPATPDELEECLAHV